MEDGLLSLKWNNHKTTFFEILKVLRDKANYTDATLAVDGKFYPVHKLVLSTCSEYFSEIFERTPCKSPVIVLKDVRSQDLESLLDYMYLGEVNVNQNDLALLLKTAECLRIKGLAVPDEDPTRHSTPPHTKVHTRSGDETVGQTPPAKRRKEEHSSSIPSSNLSPPVVPPLSRVSSSPPPHHSLVTNPTSKSTTVESCSPARGEVPHLQHHVDVPEPLVKVEMEENDEADDSFQNDNYDSNTECEGRDFTVEKSEHDPSMYPNTNYSNQQSGDAASWEDGENSFPADSFGGDSSNPQNAGKTWKLSSSESITSASTSAATAPSRPASSSPERLIAKTSQSPLKCICYYCPICPKIFHQKMDMERHLRTHTGEKPFVCIYCGHAAAQKGNLKAHIMRVHPNLAVLYKTMIQRRT